MWECRNNGPDRDRYPWPEIFPQNGRSEDGTTGRETTVKQVAHRLAHCWRYGAEPTATSLRPMMQIFYDERSIPRLNQACVPNGPQWFNTGLHEVYGITGKTQGHYYVDPTDGQLKNHRTLTNALNRTHALY